MATFGERLTELRTEYGYSYRELAAMCNISKSSLVLYERGERKPKYETLEAIARAFHVDVDYLQCKSDLRRAATLPFGQKLRQVTGRNIRLQRERAGMTQKQLAKRLGVSERTVAAIEEGARAIDKELLFSLCDLFSVLPNMLDGSIEDEVRDDTIEYLLSRPHSAALFFGLRASDVPPEHSLGEAALSEQEKVLVHTFRATTAEGRLKIIQATLNICEAIERTSPDGGGRTLLFEVASSEDHHPGRYVLKSSDKWKAIKETPESEDPLL